MELKIKNAFESKQISNDDLSGPETAGLTNEIAQIQKEKKHKQELMTQLQIVEQQIHQKMVQRVNESILANPGITSDPLLDPKLIQGHGDLHVNQNGTGPFANQVRGVPEGNAAPGVPAESLIASSQTNASYSETVPDPSAPPPNFNYHRDAAIPNQEHYDQETIDQETIKVGIMEKIRRDMSSVYSEYARIHSEPRHPRSSELS